MKKVETEVREDGKTYIVGWEACEKGFDILDAEIVQESEKAFKIEIAAVKMTGDPAKITAWIPKSVSKIHSHGIQVANWKVNQLRRDFGWAKF